MTITEYLEREVKIRNKKLAYAITDGYEVIFYNKDDPDKDIYYTDTYSIIHEVMSLYGLKDESP